MIFRTQWPSAKLGQGGGLGSGTWDPRGTWNSNRQKAEAGRRYVPWIHRPFWCSPRKRTFFNCRAAPVPLSKVASFSSPERMGSKNTSKGQEDSNRPIDRISGGRQKKRKQPFQNSTKTKNGMSLPWLRIVIIVDIPARWFQPPWIQRSICSPHQALDHPNQEASSNGM